MADGDRLNNLSVEKMDMDLTKDSVVNRGYIATFSPSSVAKVKAQTQARAEPTKSGGKGA